MTSKLAIVFASALLSSAAFAAAPAFEEVDSDGNSAISAVEAAFVEGLDIASADTNGVGVLSRNVVKYSISICSVLPSR